MVKFTFKCHLQSFSCIPNFVFLMHLVCKNFDPRNVDTLTFFSVSTSLERKQKCFCSDHNNNVLLQGKEEYLLLITHGKCHKRLKYAQVKLSWLFFAKHVPFSAIQLVKLDLVGINLVRQVNKGVVVGRVAKRWDHRSTAPKRFQSSHINLLFLLVWLWVILNIKNAAGQ